MIFVPRCTKNLAGVSNFSYPVKAISSCRAPSFQNNAEDWHCSMLWISVPNPFKRARRRDCSHCSIQHLLAPNSRLFRSSGFPSETFEIGSGLWQGFPAVPYFSCWKEDSGFQTSRAMRGEEIWTSEMSENLLCYAKHKAYLNKNKVLVPN